MARRDVTLLTYCITSNHVHLLLHAPTTDELAAFMQRVAGGLAQAYNMRKGRKGAFWSDRYHAAMIESGEHLWACMRYIDLNMVRAGVVAHPSEWDWTGWGELMGTRRRNRLIDPEAVLQAVDMAKFDTFREIHAIRVEEAIRLGRIAREPWWSSSVAVGGPGFAEEVARELSSDYRRRRLEYEQQPGGLMIVREPSAAYGAENGAENRPISRFSQTESGEVATLSTN